MKGQGKILEYAILVFFMAVILFLIISLLTGFQILQVERETQRQTLERALSISKRLYSSPYIADEELMLNGKKLTSASEISCAKLEDVFGPEWFMKVRLINGQALKCSMSSYPECSYWEMCIKNKKNISYVFPVNVMINDKTMLAYMEVGVYT